MTTTHQNESGYLGIGYPFSVYAPGRSFHGWRVPNFAKDRLNPLEKSPGYPLCFNEFLAAVNECNRDKRKDGKLDQCIAGEFFEYILNTHFKDEKDGFKFRALMTRFSNDPSNRIKIEQDINDSPLKESIDRTTIASIQAGHSEPGYLNPPREPPTMRYTGHDNWSSHRSEVSHAKIPDRFTVTLPKMMRFSGSEDEYTGDTDSSDNDTQIINWEDGGGWDSSSMDSDDRSINGQPDNIYFSMKRKELHCQENSSDEDEGHLEHDVIENPWKKIKQEVEHEVELSSIPTFVPYNFPPLPLTRKYDNSIVTQGTEFQILLSGFVVWDGKRIQKQSMGDQQFAIEHMRKSKFRTSPFRVQFYSGCQPKVDCKRETTANNRPIIEVTQKNKVTQKDQIQISKPLKHEAGDRQREMRLIWANLAASIATARKQLTGADLECFEAIIARPSPGENPAAGIQPHLMNRRSAP